MILLTSEQERLLLGRPVRPLLRPSDRAAFAGQRCLVTGAGGSLGSELARQLAACQVAQLTLLEHSEHGLFQIERELQDRWPGVSLDPVLGDVTRPGVVRQALGSARPHVVFHAAAYKHVGMSERAICAAARVNVLGTALVVGAARRAGARFMLVSSDKAAAPKSVMGATKRMAELLTLAANGAGFRTAVVRFGNVLASSGSVLTIMTERVHAGRPIPITDPNASRYFMTVSEAVSLVMKADTLARGGETFWLDMGEPIRIGDLAERLLSIAEEVGLPRVPIEIIGLRPGEKLAEELTSQGLELRPTPHRRIRVARQPAIPVAALQSALGALRRAVARGDAMATLDALVAAAPEFVPSAEARTRARADRPSSVSVVGAYVA